MLAKETQGLPWKKGYWALQRVLQGVHIRQNQILFSLVKTRPEIIKHCRIWGLAPLRLGWIQPSSLPLGLVQVPEAHISGDPEAWIQFPCTYLCLPHPPMISSKYLPGALKLLLGNPLKESSLSSSWGSSHIQVLFLFPPCGNKCPPSSRISGAHVFH